MVLFYAHVSTKDQTAEHQIAQAREVGFTIDRVISDEGVSGVSVPLARGSRSSPRKVMVIERTSDGAGYSRGRAKGKFPIEKRDNAGRLPRFCANSLPYAYEEGRPDLNAT